MTLRTVQKIIKRGEKKKMLLASLKLRICRNDEFILNSIAKSLNTARSSVQAIVKDELGLGSYRMLTHID
ncbi:unnamed protein product [Cylicostephanus goldi]|uniref:Uncharacterized protein n=1 Tax=Cylicostephanus goldi TaxID=71465 RepID=A0A3P7MM60_CYLGO|nr:unnamed protein product [Cylicostephanus goldi]